MEEKKDNTSYITGILGAFIGGFIATIPWILTYVYGEMMLSFLAVIIAAGEFYGYKLCKGKIDKKLPTIIMILAIIIVTITTLVIIPALLLAREHLNVSIQSIKVVYSNGEFSSAIMRDYIIAVLFTILGASAITNGIKKQIANSENPNEITLNLSNNEEQNKLKQDSINLLKPIFERYSATSQETTMTKEEILAETEDKNGKMYFNYLKNLKIIKKYQGRYYYSLEDEKNDQVKKSNSKATKIIVAGCIIVAIVAIILSVIMGGSKTIENDDVSYKISSEWLELEEYSETKGWTYYRYISNSEEQFNQGTSQNVIDYTKYPATIQIDYDKEVMEESYETIEELKADLEDYIKNTVMPDNYDIKQEKNSKGENVLKARVEFLENPYEIDYIYYIMHGEKLVYISGATFSAEDDMELKNELDSIAENFEWKK